MSSSTAVGNQMLIVNVKTSNSLLYQNSPKILSIRDIQVSKHSVTERLEYMQTKFPANYLCGLSLIIDLYNLPTPKAIVFFNY